MTNALIEVDSVSYSIGDKVVLDDISFKIHRGEIITMIGPNGSGKTTLVKIILGLLRSNSGTVRKQEGLKAGYAPQYLGIDGYLPLTVANFVRSTVRGRMAVDHAVELTGIENLMYTQLSALSGGELKKVMLTKALITGHDVLFLDEPVSCLDLNQKDKFYNIIRQINKSLGCAVILVSHDLMMMMRYTDKVLCINKHLCCSDSPHNVAAHPSFIKLFGNSFKNIALHDHKHQCNDEDVA